MKTKILSIFVAVFILSYAPHPHAAERNHKLQILYFFSSTCPHCRAVAPLVKELSRTYPLRGYYPASQQKPDTPYPAEKSSRELKAQYKITGVPTMVVLVDGKYKSSIVGSIDIKEAPVLLRAFSRGAESVSEAIKQEANGDFLVAGIVTMRGAMFGKERPSFYLSDRTNNLQVHAWLPLEAMQSKFKRSRPRLMSDVVNRAVALRGVLGKDEKGALQFQVKEEVRVDQ